jgi:hypothetical protein
MTLRPIANRVAGYKKGQITAIWVAASVLAGLCAWQYTEAPRRYRAFVENSTQGIAIAQRDLEKEQVKTASSKAAADSTVDMIKSILETGGSPPRFLYDEAKLEARMYQADSSGASFREQMVRDAQDTRSRDLDAGLRSSETAQLALVLAIFALILVPAAIVFMWFGQRGIVRSVDERIANNV